MVDYDYFGGGDRIPDAFKNLLVYLDGWGRIFWCILVTEVKLCGSIDEMSLELIWISLLLIVLMIFQQK